MQLFGRNAVPLFHGSLPAMVQEPLPTEMIMQSLPSKIPKNADPIRCCIGWSHRTPPAGGIESGISTDHPPPLYKKGLPFHLEFTCAFCLGWPRGFGFPTLPSCSSGFGPEICMSCAKAYPRVDSESCAGVHAHSARVTGRKARVHLETRIAVLLRLFHIAWDLEIRQGFHMHYLPKSI